MAERKIRHQLLIPLTLTFIILAASFIYGSYWMRMAHYEKGMQQRQEQVQHVLEKLIADRTKFMVSSIEFIAEQKNFQEAMQTKDREALLRHGSPVLQRLFSHQEITHFYFYDKKGEIVLRVYHPEDISPSQPRLTRQQAIAQGKAFSGLELGNSGTFTLRVVAPWEVNGQVIGYIELGQEYDHLLQELKAVTRSDYAVLLDKNFLDRDAWEAGMKVRGRPADWNLLADRVLVDQTVPLSSNRVSSLLTFDAEAKKYGKGAQVDTKMYRIEMAPLQDIAQHTVGELVTISDSTSRLATIRTFTTKVVIFSLLLCSGLFAYSYKILGRVDQRLRENREQLGRDFEKQSATNKQLEVEVSERWRAERDLVAMNEDLEERVTVRTKELKQLNRELEINHHELEEAYKNLQVQQVTILQQDRMACIGQLAASVAHDINNPIGFVAGNLEVLKNYWGKLSTFIALQDEALRPSASQESLSCLREQRQKLKVDYVLDEFNAVLEESMEGTERVNRIVLNLKGFSRLDEKEARLADIHDCLESTLNIVMNELRYKADIKRDYGQIPPLLCYPQQLNQVFMNLLINASHAIERWGEITIRTWADEKNIYVAIADTGGGIADENLPKIFAPFFSTKEATVGTGLGLSIVWEIVKKHQGEITVKSELREGTVFTVSLPQGALTRENAHV